MFYAARYGLLHSEFEMIHRSGTRIRVRPNTDDLKIVKSNFVTRHYMRDFIPITKESIVIDAGTHIGSFSMIAATIAFKVLAFEPDPSNYRMLNKNIELNNLGNICTFQMAVSGSNGYQDIYIYEDGSTGSHSLYRQDKTGLMKKRIQTISIDKIIEKEGLPAINFLKLDCEGAEHDIFRNMSVDTAAKIRAIAMETHSIGTESSINIPTRLRELGFEVRTERGYVYAKRIP